MPVAPAITKSRADLMRRLIAYRESLGNPESKALIADALDELSRSAWQASERHEWMKGAIRLFDIATPDTSTPLYAALVEAGRAMVAQAEAQASQAARGE